MQNKAQDTPGRATEDSKSHWVMHIACSRRLFELRHIRQDQGKVLSKNICNLADDKDKQEALRMFCRISA